MKLIFTFIFILSMAAGTALGYYKHYDWVGYTITLAVSGFIGSSIIALLFSYLYLFHKEKIEQEHLMIENQTNHNQELKKIEK